MNQTPTPQPSQTSTYWWHRLRRQALLLAGFGIGRFAMGRIADVGDRLGDLFCRYLARIKLHDSAAAGNALAK